MRIPTYVVVVVFQYLANEFVFVVVYRFDDEPVIAGKIEERTRLARGPELRENVLLRQRKEVIRRVEVKALLPQISENRWCVILELKIVLDRRRKFVS